MRSARSFACLAVVAAAAAVPSGAAASSAENHPATAGTIAAALPVQRPASGQPGRPPTPAEAELITAAVHGSPLIAGVPADDYAVTDIRLSATTPGWAYAKVVPQGKADLDTSRAVLSRRGAGWALGEIGTAFVGCGEAPASVLKEFTVACAE